MKVLLVEDEPNVGRLLTTILKKWNIDSVWAQNGREAFQILQKSSIDLLISDLVMPEMNGIELVQQLRKMERFRNLPILMISGKADKGDIAEAAKLGINGFIRKPFKPDDLKKKLFTISRSQRSLIHQRQVQQIWKERTTFFTEVAGPQIIFGENVGSVEELSHPSNRNIVTYLSHAWEAITQINAEQPALNMGYIIEDDTQKLVVHLKKHATRKWVKLILLSTQCPGNPMLIVRLFAINRKEDLPVFLVFNHPEEISAKQRKGFKTLGVRTIKRSNLDGPRWRKLIDRYIVETSEKPVEAAEEKTLSPQEIHGRILQDIEGMTSLPPLPQVYEKISALSRDPQSDLKEWIEVIKLDPMTCATILRHANSLSHGFRGEVVQIDRAIILLGKNTVAGLVATEAMRQSFATIQEKGFVLEEFGLHSMAAGFAAHILGFPFEGVSVNSQRATEFAALELDPDAVRVLKRINLPKRLKLDYAKNNPFLGGIMHDIGKVVMAHSYPGLFPLLLTELQEKKWQSSMLTAEQEVAGGLMHTTVGEILMRNWEMGDELCNAVLHHHQPGMDDTFAFLVGLADMVALSLFPFPRGAKYPVANALEEETPEQLNRFLPEGYFDQPYLRVEEFIQLAKAISPRVKYLTEKMRLSLNASA